MTLGIIVDAPMVTAGHTAAGIAHLTDECLEANLQFIIIAAKAAVIGRVACQRAACPENGRQNQSA
jgi:hypothetical protein